MATRYFPSNDGQDKSKDNHEHNRWSSSHRAKHGLLANKQDKLDGKSFFGQHADYVSAAKLKKYSRGNKLDPVSMKQLCYHNDYNI